MRAVDGACHCFQAAMHPITKNGKPVTAPTIRYASGKQRERDGGHRAARCATLIHHDERSRIANSESSFNFQFMRYLAPCPEPSDR